MSRTPETTSPTERLGKHRKDSIRFQQPDILKEEWFPVFKQGNETQEPIGLIWPLPTCMGFTLLNSPLWIHLMHVPQFLQISIYNNSWVLYMECVKSIADLPGNVDQMIL